jgi:tetratricopeptide (TPR) repeat protein
MRRIGGFLIFVCLCLFIGPLKSEAGEGLVEDRIWQSNQAYRERRYQEAVDGYLDLIRMGRGNGHIYYNLANAYFRNDQPGLAVLNYEKARLFIPRDADLNFNLSQCRRRIGVNVAAMGDPIQDIFFWLDFLTLPETFWCFAAFNALFWPFLLVRLLYKKEWTYYLFLFLCACWLIAGASIGLKWYQATTDNRAVVLPDEVDVLSGPFSSDRVLFRIYGGTIVYSERREEVWALIRTADDRRGWIPLGFMEEIRKKKGESK